MSLSSDNLQPFTPLPQDASFQGPGLGSCRNLQPIYLWIAPGMSFSMA